MNILKISWYLEKCNEVIDSVPEWDLLPAFVYAISFRDQTDNIGDVDFLRFEKRINLQSVLSFSQ